MVSIKHAKVQFAAAGDREADAVFLDLQADVGFQLFLQALADLAGGVEFAFLALERDWCSGQGRCARSVLRLRWSAALRAGCVGDGFADLGVSDAGQLDDVAGNALRYFEFADAVAHEDAVDLGFALSTVFFAEHDLVAGLDAAAGDAADGVFALEGVPGQRRNEHLERLVELDSAGPESSSMMASKDRLQVAFGFRIGRHFLPGLAVTADGVVHRVMQLVFVDGQLQEQIGQFVFDFRDAAAGLSILLMMTIGFSSAASALPSTNLVCGIGPSWASTISRQPSAMFSVRSTSPEKSAWPGVSMMLMR